MACGAVGTGERFVSQTIAHIDCQAQTIGAYGYGALSDPNSFVTVVLTGLLTLFIALFALRLMLGERVGTRDVVTDMLRIGIVLTLATSWPAWRTLGYDVVMKGPGEVASVIGGASGLPGSNADLVSRLQSVDDDIVMLTIYGTGRGTGAAERSNTIGDSFRGVALTDQEGLANGRIAFLAGVIGPLAIVRLGAGLLLALAPLMAGFLFFAATRDLFFGWLRALGALALSGLALTIVYGVEISILAPWLRGALSMRAGEVQTPSAPTELTVITFAFALVAFGLLALAAKIFFFGGVNWSRMANLFQPPPSRTFDPPVRQQPAFAETEPPSRAYLVAEAVAQTLRREEASGFGRTRLIEGRVLERHDGGDEPRNRGSGGDEPLGSSHRSSASRNYRRNSTSGINRDNKA